MIETELHCPKCDYDLRGLPENRCPECGTPFDPDELKKSSNIVAKPIRVASLIAHVFLLPALIAILGLFLVVVAFVTFNSLAATNVVVVPLLVYLYYNANSLGKRVLVTLAGSTDYDAFQRWKRFMLKLGVPILFLAQIAVVVATEFVLFRFLWPEP